jgi:hypothetical protein
MVWAEAARRLPMASPVWGQSGMRVSRPGSRWTSSGLFPRRRTSAATGWHRHRPFSLSYLMTVIGARTSLIGVRRLGLVGDFGDRPGNASPRTCLCKRDAATYPDSQSLGGQRWLLQRHLYQPELDARLQASRAGRRPSRPHPGLSLAEGDREAGRRPRPPTWCSRSSSG